MAGIYIVLTLMIINLTFGAIDYFKTGNPYLFWIVAVYSALSVPFIIYLWIKIGQDKKKFEEKKKKQ